MKKLTIVFIAVVCLFSAACSSGAKSDPANNSPLMDISEISKDNIEVYIKTNFIGGVSLQTPENSAAVHFNNNADEQGIDVSASVSIKADVPTEKTVQMFGDTYKVDYKGSKITSDKTEKSDFNRRFDTFWYSDSNSGDKIRTVYINGTDTIGYIFRDSDSFKEWTENDEYLSEEELCQTAKEFLLSVLPEEEFDKYTLIDISYPKKRSSIYYDVTYRRYINGYETDDILSVMISQNKMVVSYNGKKYNKYSSVEALLTKERLDAVSDALNEKISSLNIECERIIDGGLVTDIYGNVYISVIISYGDRMDQLDCLYATVIPSQTK